MADSILVFVSHEQRHRAFGILDQAGIVSPDGTIVRAVENAIMLIVNSPCAAEVALTQVAPGAGPDKPALLSACDPNLNCPKARSYGLQMGALDKSPCRMTLPKDKEQGITDAFEKHKQCRTFPVHTLELLQSQSVSPAAMSLWLNGHLG